jgi:hypothetical protein
METLTLSDRSLKQSEISLLPFLTADERHLVMHCTVAKELGFNPSAPSILLIGKYPFFGIG